MRIVSKYELCVKCQDIHISGGDYSIAECLDRPHLTECVTLNEMYNIILEELKISGCPYCIKMMDKAVKSNSADKIYGPSLSTVILILGIAAFICANVFSVILTDFMPMTYFLGYAVFNLMIISKIKGIYSLKITIGLMLACFSWILPSLFILILYYYF